MEMVDLGASDFRADDLLLCPGCLNPHDTCVCTATPMDCPCCATPAICTCDLIVVEQPVDFVTGATQAVVICRTHRYGRAT